MKRFGKLTKFICIYETFLIGNFFYAADFKAGALLDGDEGHDVNHYTRVDRLRASG